MKEQTEQKIREFLDNYEINISRDIDNPDIITLNEMVSENESASEIIWTNICNIIEKDEKVSFYSKSLAKNLDYNQKVICKCPNWNDEGYQIATWNGEEFEFSAQPNNMFDENVIAFCPIDDDGIPFSL